MQADETRERSFRYKSQMQRKRYAGHLRAILADDDQPRREEQLLVGIWQLLLDIRDRLPAPSEESGVSEEADTLED
jgi:hypothetical protein